MNIRQKGLLITTLGVLFVVPDSLFVRLITAEPMVVAFWRSLVSGLLIALALLVTGGFKAFSVILQMGGLGWLYCAAIGSTSPAFVLAVSNTSVANVVFIFAAIPVFAAFLSWIFLKEPVTRRLILTMIGVGVGLAIIAFGGEEGGLAHWSGDAFALYVAFAYAGALTILRGLKDLSMVPAIPVGYLLSALVIALFIDPFGQWNGNINLYAAHGFFIALATCGLTLGPRYISSPEVSLLILLESILAPLLVWVVLGENPGQATLVGGAIVIATLTVSNGSALFKNYESTSS